MHTFESVHANAPVREQGKFTGAAIVGALHIGAIYALLVALEVLPNPAAPPLPVSVRVLHPETKTPPQPPDPAEGVVLTHPNSPGPTPPTIDVQNVPTGPGAVTPNTEMGAVVPMQPTSGATLAVRPLSATHTIPPYPPMGIRLGYEGNVQLRISVDERGNVVSAEVLGSSGHSAELERLEKSG